MQFHQLTLENIGNHDNLQCNFTDKNFFTITGKSRAGKSTIMEALFYALTKSTHKMDKRAGLGGGMHTLKKMGTQNAKIELLFSLAGVKYTVTRETGNSVLEGNGLRITGDDEITAHILSLLNLTRDQLQYILFLGQGQVDLFLSAKPADVTRIVESILDTSILGEMHTELNTRKAAIHSQKKMVQGAINTLVTQIAERNTKRDNFPNYNRQWFQPFRGQTKPWSSCDQNVQQEVSRILRDILDLNKKLERQRAVQNTENTLLPLVSLNKLKNLCQQKEQRLAVLQNRMYQTNQLNQQQKKEFQQLIFNVLTQPNHISDLQTKQQEWNTAQQQLTTLQQQLEDEKNTFQTLLEKNSKEHPSLQIKNQAVRQQQQVVDRYQTNKKKEEKNRDSLLQKIQTTKQNKAKKEQDLQKATKSLVVEQAKLLDKCVQYVQLHIGEHSPDECPVCEQKLSHVPAVQEGEAPTQKDFSDIQKLQQEIQKLQQEITNLNAKLSGLEQDKNGAEQKIQQYSNRIATEKTKLKTLQDEQKQQQQVYDQVQQAMQEKSQALKTLKNDIDKLSKINVPYSWLKQQAHGIFQGLENLKQYAKDWDNTISTLSDAEKKILFPNNKTGFEWVSDSFQQQLQTHIDQHSPNNQLAKEIADLTQQIQNKRDELKIFWQNFVAAHAEWQNLIDPETLSLDLWNELIEALRVFQDVKQKRLDETNKMAEKQCIEQQENMVNTLATHFSNTAANFPRYLANQLYTELCQFSQPFLTTFLGANCSLSYKNGFYLTQNRQKLFAKSLSGGERFYVSLALAFGLREYLLQKANMELKTIFIDEGFHMIKDQAVDDLLTIFESLSQANNIAFITHNDLIVSKMKTKLEITQNNAKWVTQ